MIQVDSKYGRIDPTILPSLHRVPKTIRLVLTEVQAQGLLNGIVMNAVIQQINRQVIK